MHPIAYLFTGHYLRIRCWAMYRVDCTINALAALMHDGASLLLLTVIFINIRQLKGWSFNEMLFIWGFAVITRNLGSVFMDVSTMISTYIRRGTMDRVLTRPQPLLIQLAAENGMNIYSIGRTAIGLAAIIYVLPRLVFPLWIVIYLPFAIVCASALCFCLQLTVVCLGFYFREAFTLLGLVNWMNQFGQYPVQIFSTPLRVVFSWFLPYAMMGFFPVAFLLCGGAYAFYGLVLPVMTLVFFGFAALAWKSAIRHYTSTGS